MKLELEVINAVVVQGFGVDKCSIFTTLPYPMGYDPEESTPTLSLKFETTDGKGPEYLLNHFNIPAEIIEIIAVKGYEK